MRAITVKQPWASAIASGVKDVENRTRPYPWANAVGDRIAIHAGKTWDTHADVVRPPLLTLWEADLRRQYPDEDGYPVAALLPYCVPGFLPQGYVLATAALTEVHTCDGSCSPWAVPGGAHLMLADVQPVPPVAAKGRLGLWTLDDDTVRAFAEQVAHG